MSVLIKGFSMPTKQEECPFCDYEQGNCLAWLKVEDDDEIRNCYKDSKHGTRFPEWCPLIELPDHGDLIDADWLKEECKEPKVWWETETQMKEILANAPVVIPAERSEASLCDNCDQRNDNGCCVCKYIKERSEDG